MASTQLDLVIRLAREREELAVRALADAQAQQANVEAQLQQILDYQRDYRAKARGEQGHALSASQLVEARRFLTEINSIVEAQQSHLQQMMEMVSRQQQAWAEAARYTRAVEKLAADRRSAEQASAEKRLQQHLDDLHGQRRYYPN